MKLKKVFTIVAMLSIVFMAGCKKIVDTGVNPNVENPIINSTDPADNATGVALNQLIIVTFSEPMDQATITSLTFTLKQGSTSVPGEVTYTGTTAIFTPSGNLAPSTIYTGTITTDAKNMAGYGLVSDNTFSFTTGTAADNVLPVVNSTDPVNNSTDVPRNKVIAITFSKAMNPSTINTTTFTLMQGTTAVPGTVTYYGTSAAFTPTNILAAGTVYTATVTNGAKDLAGNALATNNIWSFTTGSTLASLAVVDLGAAGNYVILAKTAITNVPTSAITGDLGISPAAASYITGLSITKATGYATSAQVTGKIYAADMAAPTGINLTTAVSNMIAAYTDAAGRPFPDFSELGTGNIGGKTLAPGLYKWTNSVTMPSNVTISGSDTDVWIFQIAGNLNMSKSVLITLTGGALARNIFWQVAGTVTLGISSHFEGIILSKTAITFQTSASINGRALAQTLVALDKNTVIEPQ
jgi:Ice-binding-like/Bacterial Ig-like domain